MDSSPSLLSSGVPASIQVAPPFQASRATPRARDSSRKSRATCSVGSIGPLSYQVTGIGNRNKSKRAGNWEETMSIDLSRRGFLGAAAAAAALPLPRLPLPAPEGPKFRLGTITYNIGATWDVPTLLQACKAAGYGDVELRTTHAHKVEPTLTAEQRRDVKKQFDDAG